MSARSLSSSCLSQGAFGMFVFANNQSREGVTASVLSSLPREGGEWGGQKVSTTESPSAKSLCPEEIAQRSATYHKHKASQKAHLSWRKKPLPADAHRKPRWMVNSLKVMCPSLATCLSGSVPEPVFATSWEERQDRYQSLWDCSRSALSKWQNVLGLSIPLGWLQAGLPEVLRGERGEQEALPGCPSGISGVTADRSFIKINLVLPGKDINKLSSNEKCEGSHTPLSGPWWLLW